MNTVLLEAEDIQGAVTFLKKEELVVIPTETVYGLAAMADSEVACKKIFAVKQRPLDNPLIIHCSDVDMARSYMSQEERERHRSSVAKALHIFDSFGPSPLTLVVQASDRASLAALAGGSSVALRIPRHELTRRVIALLGSGVAAPSANISGKPSATNALMAWEALYGKVAAVLDGGKTQFGIESTILDCTREGDEIAILREGSMGAQEISQRTGYRLTAPRVSQVESEGLAHNDSELRGAVRDPVQTVPGTKYRHYAPQCELRELNGEVMGSFLKVISEISRGKKIGVAMVAVPSTQSDRTDMTGTFFQRIDSFKLDFVRVYSTWDDYAQDLFEIFSDVDSRSIDILYLSIPRKENSPALYDRIQKAMQGAP